MFVFSSIFHVQGAKSRVKILVRPQKNRKCGAVWCSVDCEDCEDCEDCGIVGLCVVMHEVHEVQLRDCE